MPVLMNNSIMCFHDKTSLILSKNLRLYTEVMFVANLLQQVPRKTIHTFHQKVPAVPDVFAEALNETHHLVQAAITI